MRIIITDELIAYLSGLYIQADTDSDALTFDQFVHSWMNLQNRRLLY
jgi:hypothetical protein